MASEDIPLKGFSSKLNRLEQRLSLISTRFEELDEAAQRLTEKLERHRELLNKQHQQDKVWAFLLENRLSATESHLLLGYVVDALKSCHTCLLKKVPELARSMPTLASALRRRERNRRVAIAWQRALGDLVMTELDVQLFSTFFVFYGPSCDFKYREEDTAEGMMDAEALIHKTVQDVTLRDSLLKAVRLGEARRAGESRDMKT